MSIAPEHAPVAEHAGPRQADTAPDARVAAGAPQRAAPVSATAGAVQVGAADDSAEHAADAIADQVVKRLHASEESSGSGDGPPPGAPPGAPPVRRASSAGAGTIGAAGGHTTAGDAARLSASRGGGTPLSGDIRSRFGTAMGADLSGVRVHTGAEASNLNERFSARAFTLGKDVYFRDGHPDVGTEAGTRLMAHELAHTLEPDRTAAHRLLDGGTIRRDDTITAPSKGGKKGDTGKKAPPKKGGFFANLFGGSKKKKEEQARLKEEQDRLNEEQRLQEEQRVRDEERQEQLRLDTERRRKAQEELDRRTKSYDEIGALKLPDLEKFVGETPDWDKHSTLKSHRIARITALATFAGTAEAGACPFAVADILAIGTSASAMTTVIEQLTTYGKAVQNDPFPISQAATATEAVAVGADLAKLIAAFEGWVLATAMKARWFDELRKANLIDELIAYHQGGTAHPIFQAENGADFLSYLRMRLIDNKDPASYQSGPLKDFVRNFHRFEARLLDRLILNVADASKTKPLTLVLHATIDHNGAFHRDPELFKVVDNGTNNTLLVEGGENLDAYKARIGPLARDYGLRGKVDQVMFAGHGNSQSMQLGGTIEKGSDGRLAEKGEGLDVGTGATSKSKTEELFDEVLANMDQLTELTDRKQPHRRILLNACLTNSNFVGTNLTGDEDTARQKIREWITANMSLATYLNDKAKKSGSDVSALGANASINVVELIDSGGGLDLVTSQDPKVTASKLEYVEFGTEPTGVLRATLESFGNDRGATLLAMRRRMSQVTQSSPFRELIIWSVFKSIAKSTGSAPVSGGQLNNLRIWAELAEDFAKLQSDSGGSLAGLRTWLKNGWGEQMIDPLVKYSAEAGQPKQGLMLRVAHLASKPGDGARRQALLDWLDNSGTAWTVKSAVEDAHAGRYLDIQLLDEVAVLPNLLTGPATRGKLVLALAGQLSKQKPAACTDYLRAQRLPALAKIDELPEVPEVPEVKERPAPRALVPEVPAVPGRPKVDEIPGQRKAYPVVPDLDKLDALPEVKAPTPVKGKSSKEKPKVVMAPGRKGRPKRDKAVEVPAVEPYFDDSLKIEELLGGASTVAQILKAL